jgi:hypothetical protein
MTRAGLWLDREATPRQQQLGLGGAGKRKKLSQADALLAMLRVARASGRAVELPEIMRAGLAQHGARILELRERGFVIENELERSPDGRVLSRYWLRYDPERDAPAEPKRGDEAPPTASRNDLLAGEEQHDDG